MTVCESVDVWKCERVCARVMCARLIPVPLEAVGMEAKPRHQQRHTGGLGSAPTGKRP